MKSDAGRGRRRDRRRRLFGDDGGGAAGAARAARRAGRGRRARGARDGLFDARGGASAQRAGGEDERLARPARRFRRARGHERGRASCRGGDFGAYLRAILDEAVAERRSTVVEATRGGGGARRRRLAGRRWTTGASVDGARAGAGAGQPAARADARRRRDRSARCSSTIRGATKARAAIARVGGERRRRADPRHRADDGRHGAVARRGGASRADRRAVAARADAARPCRRTTPRRSSSTRCRRAMCWRCGAGCGGAARRSAGAAAVDALRPHSQALWQRARRRPSSGASCAMRGRSGTSTATASRRRSRGGCRRLIGEGRLEIVAGRVQAMREEDGGAGGRDRAARSATRRRASATLRGWRSTAPGRWARWRGARDPLLRQLIDDGLVAVDRLGIGLGGRWRASRGGRAGVGAGAADQGRVLGNRRGA